mgnify:CR=1 FL=1
MYCPNCGLNNPDNALNYSACGAALGAQAPGAAPPVTPTAAPVAQKSKLTAGLLAIFLGTLGIHNFYLGYTGKGIAQIFVTLFTCGFGAIWGLIEGILILCGNITTDANGNTLSD